MYRLLCLVVVENYLHPLGQVFASFDRFKRLPLRDRASIAGLLAAMLDFNRTPEVFALYDKMTAYELFRRVGVTKRLVDDFLRPTLLVGLFKPGRRSYRQPSRWNCSTFMHWRTRRRLMSDGSQKGTVQTTLLETASGQVDSHGRYDKTEDVRHGVNL